METAESVFAASGRAKKAPGARLADGIADLVFSLIIYFFFMLQAAAAKNIPIEVSLVQSEVQLRNPKLRNFSRKKWNGHLFLNFFRKMNRIFVS